MEGSINDFRNMNLGDNNISTRLRNIAREPAPQIDSEPNSPTEIFVAEYAGAGRRRRIQLLVDHTSCGLPLAKLLVDGNPNADANYILELAAQSLEEILEEGEGNPQRTKNLISSDSYMMEDAQHQTQIPSNIFLRPAAFDPNNRGAIPKPQVHFYNDEDEETLDNRPPSRRRARSADLPEQRSEQETSEKHNETRHPRPNVQ